MFTIIIIEGDACNIASRSLHVECLQSLNKKDKALRYCDATNLIHMKILL